MTRRVAVVGAGLAGAACARRLADAGWHVELFDAARGPGGRLATGRAATPLGDLRFDHAAQYLTARTDAFAAKMRDWMIAGVAETWRARLVTLDDRGLSKPISTLAWVGRPGMNALVEAELDGQIVWFDVTVRSVRGAPGTWRLMDGEDVEHGFYEAVVVAVPSQPAADLLDEIAPLMARTARRARMAPCWAMTAAFDAPLDAAFDGAKIEHGPVAWAARNSSKPGRAPIETWVAHAAPGWSRQFVDLDPKEAALKLVEAFRRRIRAPEPAWAMATCWRQAHVERAAGAPFLWDEALKLGVCGDWLLGPRAELAWQSGDALAQAIGVQAIGVLEA